MKRNSEKIRLGLTDQQPVVLITPVFDSTIQPLVTDHKHQIERENRIASNLTLQQLDSTLHFLRQQ